MMIYQTCTVLIFLSILCRGCVLWGVSPRHKPSVKALRLSWRHSMPIYSPNTRRRLMLGSKICSWRHAQRACSVVPGHANLPSPFPNPFIVLSRYRATHTPTSQEAKLKTTVSATTSDAVHSGYCKSVLFQMHKIVLNGALGEQIRSTSSALFLSSASLLRSAGA